MLFYLNLVGYKGAISGVAQKIRNLFYLNLVGYKAVKGKPERWGAAVFYLNLGGYKVSDSPFHYPPFSRFI